MDSKKIGEVLVGTVPIYLIIGALLTLFSNREFEYGFIHGVLHFGTIVSLFLGFFLLISESYPSSRVGIILGPVVILLLAGMFGIPISLK